MLGRAGRGSAVSYLVSPLLARVFTVMTARRTGLWQAVNSSSSSSSGPRRAAAVFS